MARQKLEKTNAIRLTDARLVDAVRREEALTPRSPLPTVGEGIGG